MPDDLIRPPDLVGAGIAQPPQDPASLIGLLRSQGSLPSDALALLGPTPSPGQAVASALAGGVAQMRGVPNPVAQQQAQQQQQQFQQAALLQRVQERQLAMQEKTDQARLAIVESLRNSSNPNAQQVYGREMSRYAQRHGVTAAPEWFLATQDFPKDELADINNLIVGRASDDEIIARHPALKTKPGWLETQRKVLASPPVRSRLGFPEIDDDPAAMAQKREADRVQNWIRAHPAYEKQGSDLYIEANRIFRKATGRNLHTSTPDDTALVDQVTERGLQVLEDREAAKKKAERDEKRLGEAKDRIARQNDRPLPVPAGGAVYDRTTKEFLTPGSVTLGDVKAEPTRYGSIRPADKQLLDFLSSTDEQLNLSERMVALLLSSAKNPGENLARALDLAIRGKLSTSPELAAFVAINTDLALELARALSGGGQLRVTVLRAIEKDIMPNTRDTLETAAAKLALARRTLSNRQARILGEKTEPFILTPATGPLAPPKAGDIFDRPRKIRAPDGRTGTLPPGVPLPAGVQVLN